MAGNYNSLNETQGMGVPFLYPLGYQGVGQYPPEYLAALFPDALIYIAADERLQKCWEAEPFKIDHLKPQPIFNKAYGKLSLVSTHPKLPPGESVPWKPLPPDPDEKLYPSGPAHPCMVSEPKCLPGNIAGTDAEKFGDPCHGMWKMPENKLQSFGDFYRFLETKRKKEYAPLVGAMPGQVPSGTSSPNQGVTNQMPLIRDEFPQKMIVFDKVSRKNKGKLKEGKNMKTFFQFLEAMKSKENKKEASMMANADKKYRAFDEAKPKVMHDKKERNQKFE